MSIQEKPGRTHGLVLVNYVGNPSGDPWLFAGWALSANCAECNAKASTPFIQDQEDWACEVCGAWNPFPIDYMQEQIKNELRKHDCWEEEHTLYRFWDGEVLLYVGISVEAYKRASRHRRLSSWWPKATSVTFEPQPNREAALAAEKFAIQNERPIYNVVHNAANKRRKDDFVLGEVSKKILDFVNNSFGIVGVDKVSLACNISPATARTYLGRLANSERIVHVGRGKYVRKQIAKQVES